MSIQRGPKLSAVANLVLALDAANPSSYPGSGTTWTDLSGNNNHGTLTNGPTFSSANGGSIVFDGVDDFVSFSSINLGNELTVSCFVRPQTTSTIQTIFGNSAAGTNINGIRLFFNTYLSNSRVIVIEVGNGTSGDNTSTSAKVIYDTWQNITFVLNKTTTSLKIYYNGILEVQKNSTVNNYNTNAAFRLGTLIDAAPQNYILKGNVALYNVYNRELSSAEILQNYNGTKSRFGL
jgi:hypothetical protein